jgi:hypothetical protein
MIDETILSRKGKKEKNQQAKQFSSAMYCTLAQNSDLSIQSHHLLEFLNLAIVQAVELPTMIRQCLINAYIGKSIRVSGFCLN